MKENLKIVAIAAVVSLIVLAINTRHAIPLVSPSATGPSSTAATPQR